jgi:hypothetical protein
MKTATYYREIFLLSFALFGHDSNAFTTTTTTSTTIKSFTHHHNPAFTSNSCLKSSPSNNNNDDNSNPFNSLFANIGLSINPQLQNKLSEEEQLRLAKEKVLLELEEKEVERAKQVKTDAIPYLFLLLLQFTPLLGNDRIISVLYFFGVAVSTVYIAGRQVTIEESEIVQKESALAAPIGASVSIGVLYFLIKMGLDPGILYAIIVSLFGALSISDIGVPILRNVLPDSFATAKVKVSEGVRKVFKIEDGVEELPLDGLVTLILGIACTVGYWAPTAMEQKFILSNCKFDRQIFCHSKYLIYAKLH